MTATATLTETAQAPIVLAGEAATGTLTATAALTEIVQAPIALAGEAVTGALTATATLTEIIEPPIALAGSAATGTLTATALLAEHRLLAYADRVVPTGHTTLVSALIEAGASSLYNTTGDGAVLEGDDPLAISDHDLNFTRIYIAQAGRLRISDSGSGDIEALFSSGVLAAAQINIQIDFASIDVVLTGEDIDANASTAHRLLLDTTPDELAALQGIGNDDRFLFSITQPPPPDPIELSGSAEVGSLTATAGLSENVLPPLALVGSAAVGPLTASGEFTRISINPIALAGSTAALGSPTATATLSEITPDPIALAGEATTGALTATALLTEIIEPPIELSGSAALGSLTATSSALAILIPDAVTLRGSGALGSLTAAATLIQAKYFAPLDLSGSAELGDPTATAVLRLASEVSPAIADDDPRRLALQSKSVRPILLVEFDFNPQVRITNAQRDVEYNGDTYLSASIHRSVLPEKPEVSGRDIYQLELIGLVPGTTEKWWDKFGVDYTGLPISVYLLFVQEDGTLTSSLDAFSGKMASKNWVQNGESYVVATTWSGPLARSDGVNAVLATDADQRRRAPGDTALKYIHRPLEGNWGRRI